MRFAGAQKSEERGSSSVLNVFERLEHSSGQWVVGPCVLGVLVVVVPVISNLLFWSGTGPVRECSDVDPYFSGCTAVAECPRPHHPPAVNMSGNTIDFSLYGGAESLAHGRPPKRSLRRTVVERPQPGDEVLRPPQDPNDFLWLMTEEPHRSRRMEILRAHPEVTETCTRCR